MARTLVPCNSIGLKILAFVPTSQLAITSCVWLLALVSLLGGQEVRFSTTL
jgi:hypothetical protein